MRELCEVIYPYFLWRFLSSCQCYNVAKEVCVESLLREYTSLFYLPILNHPFCDIITLVKAKTKMTELSTPTSPAEIAQGQAPPIEDVFVVVRRFNYHEANLWGPHHDSQRTQLDSEHVLNGLSAQYARELEKGLDTIQAAEGQYDPAEFPWLPEPKHVIDRVVTAAEHIRRGLSSDSYAVTDTLPKEEIPDIDVPRVRKRFLHRTRASLRAKLHGKHASTADSTVRHAEMSGNYRELTPLESQREYHEVTPHDVDLLAQEDPATFVRVATDILSPIRNEHTPLSDETLNALNTAVNTRQEEIGSLGAVLLINCWRIAQRNGSADVAQTIQDSLDQESSLRHYMELYESQETFAPTRETMKQNATRYVDEYVNSGGNPSELESSTDKPKVRMRLKPEALWSIAMRDDGFIRAGNEGTVRQTGRGYEGNYAYIRKHVETTLYGEAALDEVAADPIVYGYYANEETEQTAAMQSMARIYGGVELVFKDDIAADKRVVYGDSMNAVAVEAAGQPATPELIQKVLNERVIAEEDATALAHVIASLHGGEENTEFNPSANPYIECLLRGRLNLGDCEEIRVPAQAYDGNASLMSAISEKFGVAVVRVE